MNNPTLGQRLTQLIDYLGINDTQFAESVNITKGNLSDYKSGKKVFSAIVAKRIIKKYNFVSLDWLLNGIGEMLISKEPKYVINHKILSIPHVAAVSCGLPITRWEGYGDKFVNIEIDRKLHMPVAVTARGNSMEEYIFDGDKVIFEDVPMNEIKDGEIVLANLQTDPGGIEGLIKFVEFDKKNKLINLYSRNTRHRPKNYREDEIYKLYRYVGLIRIHKPKR